MTEAEWLACADPAPMLAFTAGKISERKLRLFAVACCRRIWSLFTHEHSRAAVRIAEKYADGLVDEYEMGGAYERAEIPWNDSGHSYSAEAALTAADPNAADAAEHAASLVAKSIGETFHRDPVEVTAQATLLRDIFGTPFRPITFSSEWRTDTVLTLAREMYESREFSAMPILADALQDAGCDNDNVLNHCRGPGPHVRGCWVVDLVLGKE